jgi:hypothetical protein
MRAGSILRRTAQVMFQCAHANLGVNLEFKDFIHAQIPSLQYNSEQAKGAVSKAAPLTSSVIARVPLGS